LRVVARRVNLLHEDAFEELAAAMAGFVPFGRLSVLVPDGPLSLRVCAASPPIPGAIGFGARVPAVAAAWQATLVEQRPYFGDDMRLGSESGRVPARAGLLSYAAFPVRVTGPPAKTSGRTGDGDERRVIALLILSFFEAGASRRVPVDLVQEVVDTIA